LRDEPHLPVYIDMLISAGAAIIVYVALRRLDELLSRVYQDGRVAGKLAGQKHYERGFNEPLPGRSGE
jgi:hypothetical protein